jgi:SAM-dependent methyltransferase
MGPRLPRPLRRRLFGDREQFGLVVQHDDPDWHEWESVYSDFYDQTQKESSIGAAVNGAGYRVLREIDLTGKRVLEVGPGDIRHLDHWRGMPELFVAADIQQTMLDRSAARLAARNIPFETRLLSRTDRGVLPFPDRHFQVIISFYAFEHLHPFDEYLAGMLRVLRPGGFIVGGIPCEGGLAWGLGRFLTTRRWLRRHTRIDPDKIICWEHPNYAQDVLSLLQRRLAVRQLRYWPTRIPSIDLNLVLTFVLQKTE